MTWMHLYAYVFTLVQLCVSAGPRGLAEGARGSVVLVFYLCCARRARATYTYTQQQLRRG